MCQYWQHPVESSPREFTSCDRRYISTSYHITLLSLTDPHALSHVRHRKSASDNAAGEDVVLDVLPRLVLIDARPDLVIYP